MDGVIAAAIGNFVGALVVMGILILGIAKLLKEKLGPKSAIVVSACCASVIGLVLGSLMGMKLGGVLWYPVASSIISVILIVRSKSSELVTGAVSKICPRCKEKNNPSFTLCWKCSSPFNVQIDIKTALPRENMPSGISEVNDLLNNKKYFDALDKILEIEKKEGGNNSLADLKKLTISAIATELYARGAECAKSEQYEEALKCCESLRKTIVDSPEWFGLDRNKMNLFLAGLHNELVLAGDPQRTITTAEFNQTRDVWQEKAKQAFKEKLHSNVMEMLIDSLLMPLSIKASVKPGDEGYVSKKLEKCGLKKNGQRPYINYAEKILDACEECSQYALKTLGIENTGTNRFKAFAIAMSSISFIMEKMGNEYTNNKLKSFDVTYFILCVLVKNQGRYFKEVSLERMIDEYQDHKRQYAQMKGLRPKDAPQSADNTVLGKSIIIIAHLVGGIDFKDKKVIDQLMEVTSYWESRTVALEEAIPQFCNELAEFGKSGVQ